MLQVWASWVNAHGGLSGHPVKVVSADDQGDPSTALSDAQNMVQNNHVVAFFNNLEPVSIQGIVNYVDSQNMPVVGGDVASNLWNQNPMLFPQGLSLTNLFAAVASVMVAAGGHKLGLFYCVEISVCTQAYQALFPGGVAQKQGLTPTYAAQITLTSPDYTAQCLNAKNMGVDVIGVVGDSDTVERVAQSCANQNYHPIYSTASIALTANLQSDPLLEGMVGPQAWFPWPSTSGPAADYQAAVRQYDPSLTLGGATSAVWVSGALLAAAVAAANIPPSQPVTSQDILNGLWTIHDNTLGGLTSALTFVKGQPAPQASCYFSVKIVKSVWTSGNGGNPTCL
jgi:branched-chain amino acid transport system substrate-binding protein